MFLARNGEPRSIFMARLVLVLSWFTGSIRPHGSEKCYLISTAVPLLSSTWGGSTVLLGDAWFTGQPYVTWNMYVAMPRPITNISGGGGHLNIFDNATNTITVGVLVGPPTSGFWGQGGPSDATRQINIAGGTFILPTANAVNVTNWIERGIFVVYGKQFDTNEIIITDDGTNTYVTVPPLGGAMQSISLSQPRSTMMVGTFQNPVALGNFPNIQGAQRLALDAAQTGPGTLTYNSSRPQRGWGDWQRSGNSNQTGYGNGVGHVWIIHQPQFCIHHRDALHQQPHPSV